MEKIKEGYGTNFSIVFALTKHYTEIQRQNFYRFIDSDSSCNKTKLNFTKIKIEELQTTDKKKNLGVYYTPKDITDFIVGNILYSYINSTNTNIYSFSSCLKEINDLSYNEKKRLLSLTTLDPTSGVGDFLISILKFKLSILENLDKNLNDKDYLDILKTIYGNDISDYANTTAKIRIYNIISEKLKLENSKVIALETLNKNFSNIDFVYNLLPKKFDIIIGNPPYVEYSKQLQNKPIVEYGNIYANVLHNSCRILNKNGALGFIIPLSYVSTNRMSSIREFISNNIETQFILNYADRPGCLFPTVHQKLSILFGFKQKREYPIYVSGYKYWTKKQRDTLFSDSYLMPIKNEKEFIPKINNSIEYDIFNKVSSIDNSPSLLEILTCNTTDTKTIYLNMRACFWMKAFSFNIGSKEYKEFRCPSKFYSFILCLLNSSLFFFYWIVVSDCWHITQRDLSLFRVNISNIDYNKFDRLHSLLEKKLNSTKVYIGSKQTEYEYKHKECKKEIDDIDSALQSVYNLTDIQVEYIKSFSINYRMGIK